MYLNYSILEETVEEGPLDDTPTSDLNDFEQVKQKLGNQLKQELSASPSKPKKSIQNPVQAPMHKILEELQDMRDLAHEENMKAEDELKEVKSEK